MEAKQDKLVKIISFIFSLLTRVSTFLAVVGPILYGLVQLGVIKKYQFLTDVFELFGVYWIIILVFAPTLFYVATRLTLLEKVINDIKKIYEAEKEQKKDLTEFITNYKYDLEKLWRTISDALTSFSDKIEDIQQTAFRAIEISIRFINDIIRESVLNPKIWLSLSKIRKGGIDEPILSLGANLKAWNYHLNRHYNDEEKSKNYYKTNTWLTYFETYFREEAFDVRRKELVTNGRNYPFMLVGTLEAMYSMMREKNPECYLHYYSVTPVSPKDWYNWPHGNIIPRSYCESIFLSLFHRSLREFTYWAKNNGDKLVHSRFILSADENLESRVFGWSLDKYEKLIEDLKENYIVNISLPINHEIRSKIGELKNLDKCFNSIFSYYEEISFPFCNNEEHFKFVPVIGKHWKERVNRYKDRLHPLYRKTNSINSLESWIEQLANNFDDINSNIKELILSSNKFSKNNFESRKNEIYKKLKDKIKSNKELKHIFNDEFMDEVTELNMNFPQLIRNFHKLSLEYSSNFSGEDDEIQRLLLELLAYRSSIFALDNPKLFKLGDLFAKEMHSHEENSFVVKLSNQQVADENNIFDISSWIKSSKYGSIEPEFAIFGISNKPKCSAEDFDEIEWKFGLATDISYPFDTAKINILDDTQSIEKYSLTIKSLLEGINEEDINRKIFRISELIDG